MYKKYKKSVFCLVLSIILICLSCNVVFSKEEHKQIIITIDGLTTQEFWNLSCWDTLEHKAWGLMSPYTPNPQRPLNAFLTLGLGIPVTAVNGDQGLAFQRDEEFYGRIIEEIAEERTGNSNHLEKIAILNLKEHKDSIKLQNSLASFGALGTVIKDNGYSRAVIGNSDLIDGFKRNSAYLIADSDGNIDQGFINKEIELGNSFAGAFHPTDYSKLLEKFIQVQKSDIILIEIGDISKLEESKKNFLNNQWSDMRKEYLEKANAFLSDIIDLTDFAETRLIVVVPNNSKLNSNRSLLPIMMSGIGVEETYLTSPTTRRLGVVANIDMAPTILEFWDLEVPSFMYGRQIKSQDHSENAIYYLDKMNKGVNFINATRPSIIKTYIFSQIVGISFFLLLLLTKKFSSTIGYTLFLFTTVVPVTLLWMGIFNSTNLRQYLVLFIITIFLILFLARVLSGALKNDILSIICLLTALSILVDIALGSPLMQNSVLGYDPVRGARFYGLGNEYMGVLIGSAITGAALFIQKSYLNKKRLVYSSIFFIITLFFIGSPKLGANVGGTIAASVGFMVTILKLANVKIKTKSFLFIFSVVLMVLTILFTVDSLSMTSNQTHMGRLISSLHHQGSEGLFNIFYRKITINFRLIRYTNWSLLFLVSFISLLFAFFRPLGMSKEIYKNYPYLAHGFVGVLAGSITALIFNDSGIVAAATMMIFPVNALMYISLKKL